MCGDGVHHPTRRHVCVCLAVYVLFGLRIQCGVFCIAADVPEQHLEALFKTITNNSNIHLEELQSFLVSIHLNPSNHSHEDHESNETHCYSAEEMLNFFPGAKYLDKRQFGQLLPTMVYSIRTDACHPEHEPVKTSKTTVGWQAIVGSLISVLVISVSGLIVVALLPMMSRRFYNVVSQFLIALSVGSLTGDAFVHLIPHALTPNHEHGVETKHDHAHTHAAEAQAAHDHREMITKSLVVLVGIYAFFLTERLTILCQNSTSRKKMKRQRKISNADGHPTDKDVTYQPIPTQGQLTTDGHFSSEVDKEEHLNTSVTAQVTGATNDSHGISTNKSANNTNARRLSVPENVNPPVDLPLSCGESHLCNRPPERPMDNARCVDHLSDNLYARIAMTDATPNRDLSDGPSHFWPSAIFVSPDVGSILVDETTSTGLTKVNGIIASTLTPATSQESLSHALDLPNGNTVKTKHHTNTVTDYAAVKATPQAMMYLDVSDPQPTHVHRDKPHGHHHGHSHDLSSVRAIAYTVIAGDGLHNFCDGIAIGAAFANNVRGGLSTAIAVLCHELPHELGDFAVLLHAGMSVKAALFYNLLSSVLCAAGTTIGLLLGHIQSIDTWLFMLTAGMFVYIALVNMMPELTTNRLKGHRVCHQPSVLFFWQNVGILFGYGVMLLIAFYEDQMI
ncbi:hypothetical protein P879_03614 [Paragonimus westermani]|uniref:Solute carrier family 39 (Zinc transporter), member 10 n=1 Tax=Paragonimus westermani TaxID=34504 RepID=A0A8T0DT77_9TREM|nr:hypothetical protein P879_03614 [Paragonimus westermani]